jgi:hypothetical protein
MTLDRRRFLGGAATSFVAAQLGVIGCAQERSGEETQGSETQGAGVSEETITADAPLTVVLVHGAFADASGWRRGSHERSPIWGMR